MAVVVSVTVCSPEGLYISRRISGAYTGSYQLPGGKMEAFDLTPAMAACRELFEETGLSVTPGMLAATYRDMRPCSKLEVHGFAYVLRDGDRLLRTEPDKAEDWILCTWADLQELADRLLPGVLPEALAARATLFPCLT